MNGNNTTIRFTSITPLVINLIIIILIIFCLVFKILFVDLDQKCQAHICHVTDVGVSRATSF